MIVIFIHFVVRNTVEDNFIVSKIAFDKKWRLNSRSLAEVYAYG